MKSIIVKNLGCKVNQSEADNLAENLKNVPLKKDVCIINTCCVTSRASFDSLKTIRKAVKENKGSTIVVTGCLVNSDLDKIKKIEGVSLISYNKIEILNKLADKSKNESEVLSVSKKRTRAFLKIQDGCNSFCSYCIIPYVRGDLRSADPEKVMEKIKELEKENFKEVVLTGIHIGKYGIDLNSKIDISKLLKNIENKNFKMRFRLSSIEPTEITDDLISLIANSNNFAKHFHIPLQSGSNFVLQKMNRKYTSSFFNDLILKIKKANKDISIGIDVITGFPYEDEKEFENTYNLIKNLDISYLHVFSYSKRQKTKASKFKLSINPEVIKKRADILRGLGREKKKKVL